MNNQKYTRFFVSSSFGRLRVRLEISRARWRIASLFFFGVQSRRKIMARRVGTHEESQREKGILSEDFWLTGYWISSATKSGCGLARWNWRPRIALPDHGCRGVWTCIYSDWTGKNVGWDRRFFLL